MTYRKLTAEDLDPFIRMRIAQLREEGAREELDLVPALKDYYRRHLKDGTFVSWLAVDGEKIVGTSGMSFVEKPPYFSCPNGRIGLLSSMYTDPAYRRRGIGLEMVRRATGILKEKGYDISYIHYTGVAHWYAKLGYQTVLRWNGNGFLN